MRRVFVRADSTTTYITQPSFRSNLNCTLFEGRMHGGGEGLEEELNRLEMELEDLTTTMVFTKVLKFSL